VSSISNLDTLPSPLIIAAQDWPAGTVGLDQLQVELGAFHFESRLLGIDLRKERVCILVPLVICRRKVKDNRVGSELDSGAFLVDLLEVEGDVDHGGSLVEIISIVAREISFME
jgi:hypothetical protein